MTDQMNNMNKLLARINKNIERVEANLNDLKQQREAILAILTPPAKK